MSDILKEELEGLNSAEEFLEYYEIEYDPSVVQVNRLHIMQRFHDYLENDAANIEGIIDLDVMHENCATLLSRAYQDFVHSDALTEKVFKVFHRNEPQTTFVPVEELMGL